MTLYKQITYQEWCRISDKLPMKGFSFDMQGTPKGYVSYDHKLNRTIYFVLDPDAERLATLGRAVDQWMRECFGDEAEFKRRLERLFCWPRDTLRDLVEQIAAALKEGEDDKE